MQAKIAKFLLQSAAVASHFCNIAADIFLVLQSLGQNCEGSRVDAVRRSHAADHRHLPCVSRKNADSQSGEAIGFGKSPSHEKILDLLRGVDKRSIDKRLSMKFEISLIDEHSSLGRRLRNLNEDIA